MANGTARPPKSSMLKMIALIILALILLIIFSVLLTWLMTRPKHIAFSIEDGMIRNFNLQNNLLSASFDFLISAHNPNRRISVYYDSIDVSVLYEDQTLAFNVVEPFYQPRRNETHIEVKIQGINVQLSSGLAKDLRYETLYGQLRLDVGIKASFRYKVGVLLKMRHRTLRVICPHVPVHYPSLKISERIDCDTYY